MNRSQDKKNKFTFLEASFLIGIRKEVLHEAAVSNAVTLREFSQSERAILLKEVLTKNMNKPVKKDLLPIGEYEAKIRDQEDQKITANIVAALTTVKCKVFKEFILMAPNNRDRIASLVPVFKGSSWLKEHNQIELIGTIDVATGSANLLEDN